MPGRYRQNNERINHPGLFDLPPVQCEKRLLPAQAWPSKDSTYYTVQLNGSFFAHLSKDSEGWKDSKGERSELNSHIGKLIEEHLASK